MNSRTLYYATTVALAGFLFGFDTVVISGANQPIKELWQLSDWVHGTFIMSMALWGTVVGALLGSFPCNKYGRKNTLVWIGILYFVSAVGSALATDPYLFSFFRFIGGLGVGASTIAAPTYTTEISTPQRRGTLVALYQFNIVFGILIAFISNYLLDGVGGDNDWRYMLGVEGIPALIYTLMVLGVPKSPRWLALYKNDHDGARKVLEKVSEGDEIDQLLAQIEEDKLSQGEHASLFTSKYRFPLLLAFLIAAFNQLSGINFILYYAPEILEKAGFATSESLLSSISIGGVNLVFTLLGMYLIDLFGRKMLMYIGSFGYIISLAAVAYGFYMDASAVFKLTFICMFIASHAIGQGAVIWVFLSEIFPNNVRAGGQSFGAGTHWVFAAIITLFGTVLINTLDAHIVFGMFSGFTILQLLFVHFMMPETKGVPLEELEKRLIK